jgi:hypothetical protein
MPLRTFVSQSKAVFRYYGFDGEPRWDVTHPDGSCSMPVAWSETEALRKAHAIDVHNAIHRAVAAAGRGDASAWRGVPRSDVLADHSDLIDLWAKELSVLGVPLQERPDTRLALTFEASPPVAVLRGGLGETLAHLRHDGDFACAWEHRLTVSDCAILSALEAYAKSVAKPATVAAQEGDVEDPGVSPTMG